MKPSAPSRREFVAGSIAAAGAMAACAAVEESEAQPMREPESGAERVAMPSVFVSHGAPNLVLRPSPTRTFLSELGGKLPRPRAIVCVSAHWMTGEPTVDTSPWPETIHDFYGFEDEMYRIRYPAPGAPEIAEEVAEALRAGGFPARREARGLDHGAWVPLILAYGEANVPITQLSVQPDFDAEHHYRMGLALAKLRESGVLVLGSGGATHNLGAMRDSAELEQRIADFDRWLAERAHAGDADALAHYRSQAPAAEWAHPTEEHYFPVVVALGAAGERARGKTIHDASSYGTLSLRAFEFA
jgi:4,5-DOPA dioxygenase extradiol